MTGDLSAGKGMRISGTIVHRLLRMTR